MTSTVTLVRDDGFHGEDWTGGFSPLGQAENGTGIDLPAGTDPRIAAAALAGAPIVRIPFANFSDGRGFTLARQLRAAGYRGRLRAQGHVLADQYAMARRAGFDEVEIDATLAARQSEQQWLARADWRAHDYQTRLKA